MTKAVWQRGVSPDLLWGAIAGWVVTMIALSWYIQDYTLIPGRWIIHD